MNPYTMALNNSGLRSRQNSTSEFESAALSTLLVAEQLDSTPFTGIDYFAEVETRLTALNVPPYFIKTLATQVFAGPRSRLNRGL